MRHNKLLRTIAERHFLSELPGGGHIADYWPVLTSLFTAQPNRDLVALHGVLRQRDVFLALRDISIPRPGQDQHVRYALLCTPRPSDSEGIAIAHQDPHHDLLLTYVQHARRGWVAQEADGFSLLYPPHSTSPAVATLSESRLPVGLEQSAGFVTFFMPEQNLTERVLETLLRSFPDLL
jgi:hypothetical protein